MAALPALLHLLRHPSSLLPGAPRGILRDLDRWVAERRRLEPVLLRPGPGTVVWPGRNEEIRSLPEPRAAHPALPCRHRTWRLLVTGPTALYRLIGCRVLGREGTVISSDNRVIEAFTYSDANDELASHPIFRRRRFPRPLRLSGTYATIVYPSAFAWYHWVTECLPRLEMLLPWLEALDGLFVPAHVEPQVLQSLEAMGVRREQLFPLEINSHVQPDVLFAPRYCAGLNLPEWVPGFLQSSIGLDPHDAKPPFRKLYISRADTNKRRVLNEEQLLPILERAGFTVVRLRDLDFQEQARLFHEAAWVVAPHGAGLVNVLYSRPGVQVIELSPSEQDGPHLFHSTTACAGGTYWWLPGQPMEPGHGPTVHQHFEIDPRRFAEALAHTGADR
jgi:hypothetical protein